MGIKLATATLVSSSFLLAACGPTRVAPVNPIQNSVWANSEYRCGEQAFYWAMDRRVSDESRYWNDFSIGQWVAAGKIVLSVDYVTTDANRQSVFDDAHQRGYIPLTPSGTAMDRMEINPEYEPD